MILFLILQYSFIIALVLAKAILHIKYKKEQESYKERDTIAAKYYESENMHSMFIKIATLEERERIYRDIHDKAGHDIVGALLVLQSLNYEDELYKKAVEKLKDGMDKIRSIVHGMSKNSINRNSIIEICSNMKIYGDISLIPIHIYNILEILTMETVTNSNKYGKEAEFELDITNEIVRFYTKNKIIKKGKGGVGINNLRDRAVAVGGSLSVNMNEEKFSLVCVMRIK